MVGSAQTAGSVKVALGRYPVKSMMGEALNAVEVSEVGLLGDRAYAIRDISNGKIASRQKSSKVAGYVLLPETAFHRSSPSPARMFPPVRITPCQMAPSSPVTRPTSARSCRARFLAR